MFDCEVDFVPSLRKRLKESNNGKVKIQDTQYGKDEDCKKFFEIDIDNKETCDLLSSRLKREYNFIKGKTQRPVDADFRLPWKSR